MSDPRDAIIRGLANELARSRKKELPWKVVTHDFKNIKVVDFKINILYTFQISLLRLGYKHITALYINKNGHMSIERSDIADGRIQINGLECEDACLSMQKNVFNALRDAVKEFFVERGIPVHYVDSF